MTTQHNQLFRIYNAETNQVNVNHNKVAFLFTTTFSFKGLAGARPFNASHLYSRFFKIYSKNNGENDCCSF